MFLFNPLKHTDGEVFHWCWLRAVEWGDWPLFFSQLIAPVLFLLFRWWYVVATIIILSWLWVLIRYKYVSIFLGGLGPFVIVLKWPVSIGVGVYFLVKGNYALAAISGFWPMITLVLLLLTPPTKAGIIQKSFMNKLGYTDISWAEVQKAIDSDMENEQKQ